MKQLLTIIIFLLTSQAYAQELISTSGDHYVNEEANAQISWSLGETLIESQSISDGIFTQGFISDYGELILFVEYNMKINFYANPFSNNMFLGDTLAVNISGCLLSVILGAVNPINLEFTTSNWLGITIGDWDELEPRASLVGIIYKTGFGRQE
jgi:hypothetical protein